MPFQFPGTFTAKFKKMGIWLHRELKAASTQIITRLNAKSLNDDTLGTAILQPTSRFVTSPNSDGHYVFNPEPGNEEEASADAVNVLYHAQGTYENVQASLRRLGIGHLLDPENFPWEPGRPLIFDPWGMNEANAYFDPSAGVLVFGYFRASDGRWVDTCDASDVVSHEMGHAILHILKPGFIYSPRSQTGGFHEHFGDMVAIWHALAHDEMRRQWYEDGDGDFLSVSTLVSRLAAEFGAEIIPGASSLRDANNNLRLGDVSGEVHDLSQVMTGAAFETMMSYLNAVLLRAQEDGTLSPDTIDNIVQSAIQDYQDVYMKALVDGPKNDISFSGFAQRMLEQFNPETEFYGQMIEIFENRDINIQGFRVDDPDARHFELASIDHQMQYTTAGLLDASKIDHEKAHLCGYYRHAGGLNPQLAAELTASGSVTEKCSIIRLALHEDKALLESEIVKGHAKSKTAPMILSGFEMSASDAYRRDTKAHACLHACGLDEEQLEANELQYAKAAPSAQ